MTRPKPEGDPLLVDILQGVDIVGTMIDQELPRLRADLADVRAAVDRLEAGRKTPEGSWSDVLSALTEIRELLELQEQRLLKLDTRLAELAATESHGDPDTDLEVH